MASLKFDRVIRISLPAGTSTTVPTGEVWKVTVSGSYTVNDKVGSRVNGQVLGEIYRIGGAYASLVEPIRTYASSSTYIANDKVSLVTADQYHQQMILSGGDILGDSISAAMVISGVAFTVN